MTQTENVQPPTPTKTPMFAAILNAKKEMETKGKEYQRIAIALLLNALLLVNSDNSCRFEAGVFMNIYMQIKNSTFPYILTAPKFSEILDVTILRLQHGYINGPMG
jgi:hypothetical protein